MTKELTLKVHSFVDLITNSSSELFICPTDKTVEAVYDIVDEILKNTGSSAKAKDVVSVRLYVEEHSYDSVLRTHKSTRRYKDEDRSIYDATIQHAQDELIEIKPTKDYPEFEKLAEKLKTLIGTIEAKDNGW